MLSSKLEKELNNQINFEFFSAYIYLSMSSYLSTINLSGFANWMMAQFQEEQEHALKLYNYVLDRGGNITLESIEKPQSNWNNIIEVFETTLKHEEEVTARINNLINTAMEVKDHATVNTLQWFINEQIEEEASVSEILNQLKLIDGKGSGLFMLDREAKNRVFTPDE